VTQRLRWAYPSEAKDCPLIQSSLQKGGLRRPWNVRKKLAATGLVPVEARFCTSNSSQMPLLVGPIRRPKTATWRCFRATNRVFGYVFRDFRPSAKSGQHRRMSTEEMPAGGRRYNRPAREFFLTFRGQRRRKCPNSRGSTAARPTCH